jgi:hypothetical protein
MNILRLSILSLSLAMAIFTLGFATNPASAAKPGGCTPWPECKDDGGGGQTTDTTPPALIADLRTAIHTSNEIRLRWTSTGDDGNVGTVDHHEYRMKAQGPTCPANSADYDFSGVETTTRSSTPAGRSIELTFRSLVPETCYAFEVQPFDEAGNAPDPSYASGTTLAVTVGNLWTSEILPIETYWKSLAFDPVTHEPVILGSVDKAGKFYLTRSPDNGEWSYQKIMQGPDDGNVSLELNPVFNEFEAVIQTHGKPQHAQLQVDGSWDINQVLRASVEFTHQALSFDDVGNAAIVYSDDSLIHLATYNGSSFDIETLPSHIPGGRGPTLQFNSDGYPVIAYHNFDGDIFLATQDVSGWNYETVASRPDVYTVKSFHFNPNGEPVVMYREGLVTRYDRFIIMARRDGAGGWTAMTIDPTGAPHQGSIMDMAYTADGNLYLTMNNLGGEARVGRFCEDRTGVAGKIMTCVPTTDIDGNNVWLWENAEDTGGGGWTIAINPYDGTVAVVTSGDLPEHGNTARYIHCNPNSASVICGNQ